MKQIIIVFIVAFLIASTIGYINGRDFAEQPAIVEEIAFRDVEFVYASAPAEPDKWHYYLVSRVDGVIRYRYDLMTDSLTVSDTGIDLGESKTIWDASSHSKLIFSFLGVGAAGAGGYSLKDLATKTDSKNVKTVIAGALGAVSGYTIGYKIGTSCERRCEIRANWAV
ncbi:MAG: hypothetical protein IPK02_11535 [Candidatus Accumulibacter sp.]|uniref:Uncharacterized protein n=1 Tax=Candidatus Accumulibacter affinis TaxID=2954384 RepID=A0A935TBT5_9PROT|nr:hypothetical protein [Candidatus Accumulibacter affinis]